MNSSTRSGDGPAFVIGITGHMDIPAEDHSLLKERLRQVFQWLREDIPAADGYDDERRAWWPHLIRQRLDRTATGHEDEEKERPLPGLGLEGQRIVLLSSMAPGADTLGVEVALEEGIEVRCALPFPRELYRQASTFTGPSIPDSALSTFDGFVNESDDSLEHFPVLLQSDLELSAGQRAGQFRKDLGDRERRRMRYRAAGEYVAANSDLLIALYQADNSEDQSSAAGAEAIVEARRRGPTAGILPTANRLPWIDSGPVLHLHALSRKRLKKADAETGVEDSAWSRKPARFLPAYRLDEDPDYPAHGGTGREPSAEHQRAGYESLREAARLFAAYGAAVARIQTVDAPGLQERQTEAEDDWVANGLSKEGIEFLDSLSPIARQRRVAARLARGCEEARNRMMRVMAASALCAALLFHGFSHWHFAHKESHGDESAASHTVAGESGGSAHAAPADPAHRNSDPAAEVNETAKPGEDASEHGPSQLEKQQELFAKVFLFLAILVVAFAGRSFSAYQRSHREWLRFDARAIAEGLRVQYFWAAAGTNASVAAHYMHRQKGQLDWIRNAISSLSLPCYLWRDRFDALPLTDRRHILKNVLRFWVRQQKEFFGTAVPKCESLLHRFHTLGWGLTFAGLLQAVLILLWHAGHIATALYLILLAAAFISGAVVFFLWHTMAANKPHVSDAPHSSSPHRAHAYRDPNSFLRALDRLVHAGRLPVILLVSGLIALAVLIIPQLAFWTPETKALWIILTGASLVSGAILIAWSEKLFLAEHLRQYEAMEHLFANAAEHATHLLEQWEREAENEDSEDSAATLAELRGLLNDLGKEALDENAEWLLLHRSRPFEPFLAG